MQKRLSRSLAASAQVKMAPTTKAPATPAPPSASRRPSEEAMTRASFADSALYRTVTLTGLAKRMRPEGPPGPPFGSTAPVGVVTVPTGEAFSVPNRKAAVIE